jgi:predicted nucleic acid-binding Zn ribbon protein
MERMEQPRNSKMNRDRWDMDSVRYHLDKPPAPNREIRSVGDILKDVVDGLEQPTQENILVLREAWPKLVGEQIAKHSKPGFIKDYQLYVFVDDPGWLTELSRIKRPLLMKLQSNYRELRIRQLRFSLNHK